MHVKALAVASLLFFLGGTALVAQQVRFDNTIVTTVSGGMGYENPGLLYRPAIEVESRRLLLRGEAGIGSARKRETGDGWQSRFRADAYLRFRNFLVGGGASAAKQYTSRWSKGSVHPLFGGGFQHRQFRMLVAYLLKGNDDLNGVTGVNVQTRMQISRRLAFQPEVTMHRFYSTGRPDLPRKFGMSAGLGITYSFGNTGIQAPR